jgi:hypothetical protein
VYPQVAPGETPDDKVTILEDLDGDCRCDRHTVFAEGLMIPTGIELGDLRAETATEILQLEPAMREERHLDRRVVVSTRQIGSLMPLGLEAGLSRAELRDLVAYLSRLGRRD